MLGYLIDMDGVIYRGAELIPGADRFIRELRDDSVPFLFLTNNSQRNRRDVATKLQRLEVDAEEGHVFTCAMATARFLARQKPNGTAFVIGEGGLLTALHSNGYSIVDKDPDYVVVGEGRTLNFEMVEAALRMILGGSKLIESLYRWAAEAKPGDGLRLTAHQGPLSVIEGADGRDQIVGDGINFCGSLLNFGTPGAVVVSGEFRDFFHRPLAHGTTPAEIARFHDEKSVYLKHFIAQRVYFLSLPGRFDSRTEFPDKSDRVRLREARDRDLPWAVIYHAKRLLQADSSDREANAALDALLPHQLLMAADAGKKPELNPLLEFMNAESLTTLIKTAHLVEREAGDTICARDDTGDTMFIVLRGEIGVVLESKPGAAGQGPQDIRYGEGRVVGELGLALKRKRTAALQAVGATAMLGTDHHLLRKLLEPLAPGHPIRNSFEQFLTSRVLEHVCRNRPYFSITEGGPLAGKARPWESLVFSSRQITRSWTRPIDPERDSDFERPGVYLLASGALVEKSFPKGVPGRRLGAKRLDGHEFPILYVDLPGSLVHVHHAYQYDPESDAPEGSVVWIDEKKLMDFGPWAFEAMTRAIQRQLCRQAAIDVFISYNQ